MSVRNTEVDAPKMKKFINHPEHIVSELLEGFTLAYPGKVKLQEGNLVVRAVAKSAGKVGIVTLGGSGHEPGLSGFVGEGLLDISVAGGIFSAPGAPAVAEAIRFANRGAGVLLVILNHSGDVLSGKIALDLVREQNLTVKSVLTHDDISTGPKGDHENGRGLVGCLAVFKVAGAAAELGMDLDAVHRIAEHMSHNMRTLAVATKNATHPATGLVIGNATDLLAEGEMEIGMGQHGEGGLQRTALLSADETAETMLRQLLIHLEAHPGDELLLILNGSGATTLMELFIVFRRLSQVLAKQEIRIVRSMVGEYITTQEQAGFQMLIARMDAELLQMWDQPCDAPYMVSR